MTREERLDWLCRLRSEIYVYMPYEWIKPMDEALTDSIKELEQEQKKDVFDKIRAEIEDLEPSYDCESFYSCQSEVIKIIDKAIKEVEQ